MGYNKTFEINYTQKCFPVDWCNGFWGTAETLIAGTCCSYCITTTLMDRSTENCVSDWCIIYACVNPCLNGSMFPFTIYMTSPTEHQNSDACLGCICAPCYCTTCQQYHEMTKGNSVTDALL